ncbi:MFS transporter [Amnibacterium flavum]|uniref:MFS transporter n=1 Tax=Amnibacterium flavum TaxID=2173173 RepID=UPI0014020907|nr:MFS transporter [Amnibacterium flavum]
MTPRRTALGLALLSFSTFVAVTSELLPIGVLPQVARGLDVPESTAGLSVSVYAVLVAVLAIPMTVVTERVPRKTLLLLALAGYALSNGIGAIAPDFLVLCIGRALGGLSHAVFYSVVTAYAAALVPPHRLGRALAFAFAGASLGSVLGVPVTSLIGVQLGWQASFATMAVVAALLAIVVVIALPSVSSSAPEPGTAKYRPGRGLVPIVSANSLVYLGHNAAYTYIAPLLGLAGIEDAALGGVLLLLGVLSAAGVLVAGVLADRHLGAVFIASSAIVAVTLALLTFVGGSALPAVADSAVWVLAFGALGPLITTAAVRTGAVSDSMAGAVANSASNVGITLGSLLGSGVIALGSLSAVPIAGAVFAAAGAVVAIAYRAKFRRPDTDLPSLAP